MELILGSLAVIFVLPVFLLAVTSAINCLTVPSACKSGGPARRA
jgi:hypothetical protein